jgi:uncharacterized protein YlxP (DUF503 family)
MSRLFTATASVELWIPGAHTLKERRAVVKSLIERIRHRFNCAIAQLDTDDRVDRAVIGLACISNDEGHARRQRDHILRFMEEDGRAEIITAQTDIL